MLLIYWFCMAFAGIVFKTLAGKLIKRAIPS